MNVLKSSIFIAIFSYVGLSGVQANENVITLPTITVMVESELSEEVGFIPFQEDKKVRQSLQHQIYKMQSDLQNTAVNENTIMTLDFQPQIAKPDLSQLSPFLHDYILSIASGFQSATPTDGLFRMLEPININRDNIQGIREGTIKINLDDLLRLQQQIQDGLKMQ